MEKFGFGFLKCAGALALLLLLSGCGKNRSANPGENPDQPVPDPEGTVQVSMRNGVGIDKSTRVTPDKCYCSFEMGTDDHFIRYSGHLDRENVCRFVTIGPMKGIGNITQIPASGWTDKVPVVPGYGYVAANYQSLINTTAGVTYFQLYVEDHIKGDSGEIIGANVKYHSPFHVKPDASSITISHTAVNLQCGYNSGDKRLSDDITVSPYHTSWEVTSSTEWCLIYTTDMDKFRIWVNYNSSVKPRTAKVKVKIKGLPDRTIRVTQTPSGF